MDSEKFYDGSALADTVILGLQQGVQGLSGRSPKFWTKVNSSKRKPRMRVSEDVGSYWWVLIKPRLYLFYGNPTSVEEDLSGL